MGQNPTAHSQAEIEALTTKEKAERWGTRGMNCDKREYHGVHTPPWHCKYDAEGPTEGRQEE